WVHGWPPNELFTTAVNEAEVLFGMAIMPTRRKKELLREAAVRMFEQEFRGRILPFDREAAQPYADIVANRRRAGRPIKEFDAQIASIALRRGMAIATRDTDDFEDCGIQVLNPWTA